MSQAMPPETQRSWAATDAILLNSEDEAVPRGVVRHSTCVAGTAVVGMVLAVSGVVVLARRHGSLRGSVDGDVELFLDLTCNSNGNDCRNGMYCCSPLSNCYVKNDYWASCEARCPGQDPKDGTTWDCTIFGDVFVQAPQFDDWGFIQRPPPPDGFPDYEQPVTGVQPPAFAYQPAAAVLSDRECSWEGEDCSYSQCCRRSGFSCWTKGEGWASCATDCAFLASTDPAHDEPWSCKQLGGDQGSTEVSKSSYPAGTSLFCLSVVTPDGAVPPGVEPGYEQKLIDWMAVQVPPVGIFACESYATYRGAAVTNGDWSSVANTDVFKNVWRQVQADGLYLSHDWTVKVDVDAVFFADRLKAHIQSMQPPAYTALYLHNTGFKFHFMGALEVLSQKAITVFLENLDVCSNHIGNKGGEDFFTMQCLDAVKVGHMSDYSLLADKYVTGETEGAKLDFFDIDPCNHFEVVAFHPFKAINAWHGCLMVALGQHKPDDFVGCGRKWAGDACSLSGTRAHLGTDPKPTTGLIGPGL